MNTPKPNRKTKLTLIGYPAPDLRGLEREQPFPLTPYRDVHTYTPSHQRALRQRAEATPVMLPPAQKKLPDQPIDYTRAMLRPRLDPTCWEQALVAVLIGYVLLLGAMLLG